MEFVELVLAGVWVRMSQLIIPLREHRARSDLAARGNVGNSASPSRKRAGLTVQLVCRLYYIMSYIALAYMLCYSMICYTIL